MENKYKDESNNDILLDIKQLQYDHEALKQKMLKDYDRLMEIERLFSLANLEITNRLKGSKK
jgi:uncharacterized protein YjcR